MIDMTNEENMTKEEFLDQLEQFLEFLNDFKEKCDEKLEIESGRFEAFKQQLEQHNRATKRFYTKTPMYKKAEYLVAKLKECSDLVKRIIDVYDNDEPLTSNADYDNLIMLLALYNRITHDDITAFSKELMKMFVYVSKGSAPDIKFLRYFDDDGNVKIESCRSLAYYIDGVRQNFENDGIFTIPEESYSGIIVTEEDLDRADIEERKRREEEQRKREEMRKKLQEEKKANAQRIKGTVPVQQHNKQKYKPDPRLAKIKEYYDIDSRTLTKGCCRRISLTDLLKLLEPFIEDKTQYNKCIDDYIEQEAQMRTFTLIRVLKSEYSQFIAALEKLDEEDIVRIEYDEFINDPNFDKFTDAEIRNTIRSLASKINTPNENIVNFLVFPNENFVQEQKDAICNARTHANTETMLKSANTQLKTLQTISQEELKSNLKSAFHELKDSASNPFIIDGKLKGYRFGGKKAKTCLFTVSVHQDNQRILHEKFGWGENSKLLLIFGISNVDVKDEYDFYAEIMQYAKKHSKELLEIYDIFENPFTAETFDKAVTLIENGLKEVREFNSSITY